MGGVGSGRRRTVHPAVAEDLPVIDTRVLRRLGVLRAGECVIDTLRWARRGLNVAQARIRVDLSTPDAPTLVVTMTHDGEALRQAIDIEAVACRFGGHRYYFRCPTHGRRCETLYLQGRWWASRQAHRLAYVTQSMPALARARKRRRALHARLKGQTQAPKPRGLHRYKVVQRLALARAEERALFSAALHKRIDGAD